MFGCVSLTIFCSSSAASCARSRSLLSTTKMRPCKNIVYGCDKINSFPSPSSVLTQKMLVHLFPINVCLANKWRSFRFPAQHAICFYFTFLFVHWEVKPKVSNSLRFGVKLCINAVTHELTFNTIVCNYWECICDKDWLSLNIYIYIYMTVVRFQLYSI